MEEEWEIEEVENPDDCEHSEVRHYEYDTGCYELYCHLYNGECAYGQLEYGCPLAFKYKISN